VSRATLAFVLHTHMPYVEGFGTWPFGEEWLWEAVATSYLPLLDVLDEHPGKVTVSLTPVLADQLESREAMARCLAFLRDIRPASHALDLEAESDPGVLAELERSRARYAAAADALERRGDLIAALQPHAQWTSSATHAVLPLLATDDGVRLQVRTGIAGHQARFGGWDGGFWLPECAHAPWLHHLLEEAGVHATCVDWTDLPGGPRSPVRTPEGPVLVPIDREVVELVWSWTGYPSRPAYQDTRRLTERRHRAWAIGGDPYDPAAAAAQVRADAAEFVAFVRDRREGLVVCAIDTELLGHWWTEGVEWLRAVLEAAGEAGLRVAPLDGALREADPAPAPRDLPVTTWGTPRDLTTWSGPRAGGLAWRQRAAELRVLADRDSSPRALRELLALQSSDWAFLVSNGTAGPYPLERYEAHEAALDREREPSLRNLAPHLAHAAGRSG
jgi:1,4-alpha-glucan branching enzyme